MWIISLIYECIHESVLPQCITYGGIVRIIMSAPHSRIGDYFSCMSRYKYNSTSPVVFTVHYDGVSA